MKLDLAGFYRGGGGGGGGGGACSIATLFMSLCSQEMGGL